MPQAPVNTAAPPGWFGKMPSLGDFASRRLPPKFIEAWDAWLQHELPRSRAAHGAAWLPAYLVAPVQRFWLAPGLIGRSAWAGVWMPSVDRVGRHFPFTVASPWAARADGLGDAIAAGTWFDAIEAAACEVLDPELELEQLEQVLHAVAPHEHRTLPADSAEARLVDALRAKWRSSLARRPCRRARTLMPCWAWVGELACLAFTGRAMTRRAATMPFTSC
jgi:type VI secretion system ImpM family protein